MLRVPKESLDETKVKTDKKESTDSDQNLETSLNKSKESILSKSKSDEKIRKKKSEEESANSSSESEGCDGPVSDDDLAEATSTSAGQLSVSSVDHNSFLPSNWDDNILPDTFLSGKRRHHKRNLVIEGSCNYFFWMEKIAMVSINILCPDLSVKLCAYLPNNFNPSNNYQIIT